MVGSLLRAATSNRAVLFNGWLKSDFSLGRLVGFLCCVPTLWNSVCQCSLVHLGLSVSTVRLRVNLEMRFVLLIFKPLALSSRGTTTRSGSGMRNTLGARGLRLLFARDNHRKIHSSDYWRCTGASLVRPDVREECYLVDPASSHMLVSKIKPCMCKYELIQTVKLRMAH